ncbi:MAG: hypothetical protein CK536_01880 [Synechococcus sp. Baikal-G1]|jgi:hypothetical protein|nr:MAG: hypothetical protein CK536_01880 [Synechococcus sp. Baikal-G1]
MAQWEYRVIHINLENGQPPQAPDPQVASERLGGLLSPEFIAREFPEQYKAAPLPRHPAEQLQFFLNLLGKDGWELVETGQVGPLLMFFFKRPIRESAQESGQPSPPKGPVDP